MRCRTSINSQIGWKFNRTNRLLRWMIKKKSTDYPQALVQASLLHLPPKQLNLMARLKTWVSATDVAKPSLYSIRIIIKKLASFNKETRIAHVPIMFVNTACQLPLLVRLPNVLYLINMNNPTCVPFKQLLISMANQWCASHSSLTNLSRGCSADPSLPKVKRFTNFRTYKTNKIRRV